ncbi:MAG: DUF3262 family protein [Candidatus Sedimenticola sp. (ex Thyasira tokunagai)]
MNASQQAAFAAGSGVTHANLLLGIALIIMTLALLWLAWLAFAQMRQWRAGGDFFDFLWRIVRGGILLMFLGWFIR